jgi:hypothetical protein
MSDEIKDEDGATENREMAREAVYHDLIDAVKKAVPVMFVKTRTRSKIWRCNPPSGENLLFRAHVRANQSDSGYQHFA